MRSVKKCRLEEFIYRFAKALFLTAFLIFFQNRFNLLPGFYTTYIAIMSAVLLQLLLLIKLPDNDLVPTKIIRDKAGDFLFGEIKFILMVTFVAFFAGLNISPQMFSLILAGNFILQSIVFVGWRIYNRSIAKGASPVAFPGARRNIIIVGSSERGKKAADIFLDHPELNMKILGFVDDKRKGLWRYRDVPLIGHPDNISRLISTNQVDFVVMALEKDDQHYKQRVFSTVESMGIKICLLPDIFVQSGSKCRSFSLNGQPVFLYHSVPEDRVALFIKDIIDRVGAAVGIILSAPIIAIAALAIRIDSKGPIFFKQVRSGKNGKAFKMIKLRTMVNEADTFKEQLQHLNEMSGPVFKIQDDPRITKVGKFLRKYSVDEFPQFFNVLKGDMSLVGPRPPLPQEVEKFEPWQHRKLSVKPGLSCLWQVNGRSNLDFEHWIELDLQYIDQWSLAMDAKILAQTIPAVLKGKGAS
ncbi:MAG: sugar transferase [Candidatus Zixiibacteriota bacterium]|nr:MAG: sugar transferase [candidate division Zixibacteria bacterium]HHI03054.1 sugar transferase [candidate division Zixibacteria bacterium]